MNKINREQSIKPQFKEKKAAISLVLGIINISISVIVSLFQPYSEILWRIRQFLPLITLLVALIGLILGIMGLKSQSRKLAVIGIVLGFVGLIDSIYAYIAEIISST